MIPAAVILASITAPVTLHGTITGDLIWTSINKTYGFSSSIYIILCIYIIYINI